LVGCGWAAWVLVGGCLSVATERRQLLRACGGVEDVEVGGSVVISVGGWVWV